MENQGKKTSLAVILMAVGALIGAAAGYGIEHTSLLYFFIGHPSLVLRPGETYQYQGPWSNVFVMALGAAGAILGMIGGAAIERNSQQ